MKVVTKRPQARLNSENLQLELWSLWCDGIRDTSNILVQISFFSPQNNNNIFFNTQFNSNTPS